MDPLSAKGLEATHAHTHTLVHLEEWFFLHSALCSY